MHAVVGPDSTREGGYAFHSWTPQNFLPSDQPRLISDWAVGRTSFGCRWLLAPYYLGLSISLLVLLIKFVQRTDKLFFDALVSSSSEVVTLVLSVIDFSLIASLGLMVMLACHENFVSGFELGRYRWQAILDGPYRFWRAQAQTADVDSRSFGDLRARNLHEHRCRPAVANSS